jgi:arylsulfatase A
MKKALLLTVGIALATFLARQFQAADATKPNIIFILSADVGLGNISCYDGALKTPNIDALAKGGTRFEYYYANPVGGPSRVTCLTGRYIFHTGMLRNGYTDRIRHEETMLPKGIKVIN